MTGIVPDPAAPVAPVAVAHPGPAEVVTDLTALVSGPVYGPFDVETVTELAGFNLAAEHAPLAVVGATSVADVAAVVRWAARNGVPVGVVGTGHGSWSHRDAVVVSTKRMDAVVVDPVECTAVVAAGVRWRDVQEEAAEYGLLGLAGSSSDVGVVGHTVGGGHGPLVRTYGWAADRVRRLTLVAGDGEIHDVRPGHELFRAALGGKDVVGIVTEMEFGLVEGTTLYGGSIVFDGAEAAAVLRAYPAWAEGLDERTTTSIAILRLPEDGAVLPALRGRCVAHLRVAHVGDPAEGAARVAPMRALATPLVDEVGVMPTAALDHVHLDPPEPVPTWETGAYLASCDAEAVGRLLDVVGPQHELPLIMVEIRHIARSGAPADVDCIGRAGARWTLGIVALMTPALREIVPALGLGVLDAMAPWSTGRTPANWMSARTAAARPGSAWTAVDRAWLADLARRHDPAGILGGRRYGV